MTTLPGRLRSTDRISHESPHFRPAHYYDRTCHDFPQRRLLLLTDPRRLRAEPDPSAQIDDAGVRSPATYPTALKSREKNEGMAETGYPPV